VPDPAVLLEAGANVVLYASVLVVVGASAARWLLLPRASGEVGAPRIRLIEQGSARLALLASVCALGSCALRVWTHTVAAFGFADASLGNIKLIALESRWGQGWKVQLTAALILTIACTITSQRRQAWPFATLCALIFTSTIPLLGHAAGSILREALHGVHVLAAGIWLGTLAVVLTVPIPSAKPDPSARDSGPSVRLLILRNFWLIALPSAAAVAAAGVVAAYLYVGAFSNLWTTAYGRILLLKVALVGAIGGCGFVNWRRLQRKIPPEAGSLAIVLLEALLTIAVVLVTALLTETAHPG
jgi:putative copper export protein